MSEKASQFGNIFLRKGAGFKRKKVRSSSHLYNNVSIPSIVAPMITLNWTVLVCMTMNIHDSATVDEPNSNEKRY